MADILIFLMADAPMGVVQPYLFKRALRVGSVVQHQPQVLKKEISFEMAFLLVHLCLFLLLTATGLGSIDGESVARTGPSRLHAPHSVLRLLSRTTGYLQAVCVVLAWDVGMYRIHVQTTG